MSVYIDPKFAWPKSPEWPYGSVTHLYADSPQELHLFAVRLGLKRHWCSDHTQPGSKLLHYDLNARKRTLAVRNGAIEVDHEHKRDYYRTSEERKAEIAQHEARKGKR